MKAKHKYAGKIRYFYSVILLLGFMFLMSANTIALGQVTLRFSNPMPPKGVEYEAFNWMMNEITKRTDGRVKIQSYHGGSLLKMNETLRGIQKGSADIGNIPTPYHPKELQLWSAATPFIRGPLSPAKKAAFFWELYEKSPELKAELANLNQRLIGLFTFGKYGIGGTASLKTLADIKGVKVRCAGGYDAKHIKELGGNVVFLRGPEVYSAMQKGAIEANYSPLTTYFKYRLYEIGKRKNFLIIPQFNGIVGIVTMNQDSWNRLPSDVQKIIYEVGKEFTNVHLQKISDLEQKNAMKMKEAGVVISEVPINEVEKWANLTEASSKAKWVKDAQASGKPGKELMAVTSQLIKKYTK